MPACSCELACVLLVSHFGLHLGGGCQNPLTTIWRMSNKHLRRRLGELAGGPGTLHAPTKLSDYSVLPNTARASLYPCSVSLASL